MAATAEFLTPEPIQAEVVRDFDRIDQVLDEGERRYSDSLNAVTDSVQAHVDRQRSTSYYFDGADEQTIRMLGQQNPDVVSPYTYVKQRGDCIVTVPFHRELYLQNQATKRLLVAAKKALPKNPDYGYEAARLDATAEAFTNDSWEKVDLARVRSKGEPKVEFVTGALENQLDPFGSKASYLSVNGIVDEGETREIRRRIGWIADLYRGQDRPNFDMKGMFLLRGSGITNPVTGEPWKANVLPNDPVFKSTVGARGLIYLNILQEHFRDVLWPIMEEIYEPSILDYYKEQRLLVAYRDWLIHHETEHFYSHEEGQDERMGSLFNPFHEEHCDVRGLVSARRLADEKGAYRDDEVDAIMLVHIARKFADVFADHFSPPSPHRNYYAEGSRIELNYLMSRGVLQPDEDGKIKLLDQRDAIYHGIGVMKGRFDADAIDANQERTSYSFDVYGQQDRFMVYERQMARVYQKAA